MLKRLANFPVIDCMIILIGAMLLNTFYTQVALGNLTTEGFAALVNESARLANAPNWWKEVLFWVGRQSAFFAPIMGPLLVGTAISLILLLVRGIAALVAAVIFLVFWVSLWAMPGIWIFEFLFPLLFALIAALATLPQFFDGPKARHRILGARVFGKLNITSRLVAVLLSSALLWYIILLSKNAGAASTTVAWQTAITFAALFVISVLIDIFRTEAIQHTSGFRGICWVDVIILCVGSMMVIQVFADRAAGLYTVEQYAQLVQSYAETSNAPQWFRAFLHWAGDQAVILMPSQAVFEATVAVLLSLLIFRGPVLVLTTGMLLTFNYAEFGVLADSEGGPGSAVTGTWELSFVTITCLFVCVLKMARFIQASSWKERVFGERFFGNLHILWCLLIALVAGAALFFAGVKTQIFGEGYFMTSCLGGGVFALLLGINAFIDKTRLRSKL